MDPTASLDRMIRSRHLLTHPFYQAWSKGEVPLSTLREYAAQYHHFEVNFPRYIAGTYARIQDPGRRRVLLDNLVDEAGRSPTHPELWQRFGRALGVSTPKLLATPPSPATQRLLMVYERAALNRTAASGLGALYAYESIFPEVAREKSRGLRENFGLRSKDAHEFFRVHTVADKEHSAAERKLLAEEMRTPEGRREAMASARQSRDAWWGFLDAFQE
ncbi:MAG: CADD family putative folate metabolism protein [Thermoplasmata archaeon]